MGTTEQPYEYPELVGPRDIRLLEIRYDSESGRILCDFVQAHLDDSQVYRAISYHWGKLPQTSKVWVEEDGVRYILVRRPALSILRLLHQRRYEGFFWIDTLCINQKNADEKAQQIRLMKDIFGGAQEVLAWPGEASADSARALAFVEELRHVIEESQNTKKPIPWMALGRTGHWDHREVSLSPWSALRVFLRRPWFTRLWIVEEIVLAKKVTLLCGDAAVDWKHLARVVILLQEQGHLDLITEQADRKFKVPRGYDATRVICALKDSRDSNLPLKLLDNVAYCKDFEITDFRDRIFALLGISSDVEDEDLQPDYKSPNSFVYTRVARCLLLRDQTTKILHHAGSGWRKAYLGLPSWVPDLMTRTRPVLGDSYALDNYQAYGDSTFAVQPESYLTIQVFGRFIDRVQNLCPIRTDIADLASDRGETKDEIRWQFSRGIPEIWETVKRLEPYRTDESLIHVFGRTLISNLKLPGSTSRPENNALFNAYLRSVSISLDPKFPADQGALTGVEEVLAQRYSDTMMKFSDYRIFTTQGQYLGLGPFNINNSEEICIIRGAVTPFILRKNDSMSETGKPIYELVGECYIHGLMHGEGLEFGPEEEIVLC